uniref:Late transcription factor 3-like protein n=1 Tax=Pithovirus LCPAC101 TaxID=2506586 RepID=A0A481Z2N1_9VIRU|nr:MAG: uncharacterized protein LCPAC101_03320 [Pithovirus LCPAC101]
MQSNTQGSSTSSILETHHDVSHKHEHDKLNNNTNNIHIQSRKHRKKDLNKNKTRQKYKRKNNKTIFQIPLPKKQNEDGTWDFENISVEINTPESTNEDFNMNLSFEIGNTNISTSFRMNENEFDFSIDSQDKTEINDEYSSNLNIIDIHRKVIKILKDDPNTTIKTYKDILDNEIKEMNKPHNWKEKHNRKIKIVSLMKKISELNNEKYDEYISKSIPILTEYAKHTNNKIYVPFFTLEDNSMSNNVHIKMKLIDTYLELASHYVKLNITKQFQNINKNICTSCEYDLSNGVVVYNNTSTVCPKCQVEIPTFANHIDFESSENENNKSSKAYEEKGNFIKRLNHFIGLEPNRPNTPNTYPSNYEEILDNYFSSRFMPLGKEIKYMEYNEDGRTKGNTSKEMMFKALKYTKMTKLYKHAEWICYVYWGWKRRNIDEFRSQILYDYNISQEIIDKYRGTRSNLNRDYRLYRHLEKLGYPDLDKSDFRLIKTKDSIEYNENMWITHVVQEAGWDKSPLHYEPVPLVIIP